MYIFLVSVCIVASVSSSRLYLLTYMGKNVPKANRALFLISNLGLGIEEYIKNLLQTISKYPEHNMLTLSLIQILKKDDLI